MSMRKGMKAITAVVISVAMAALGNIAAYASVLVPTDNGQFNYYIKADYYAGQDAQSAYYMACDAIDTEFKSINLYGLCCYSHSYENGVPGIYITQSDAEMFQNTEAAVNQWLAQNMPAIVPNGTDPLSIPGICAEWVADHMWHNPSLEERSLSREYQNALRGFYEGVGVCATYAHCFEAMVSFVPINTSTNRVDYTCVDPAHLQTAFVYSPLHAWTAVKLDGVWHHYDVDWYDSQSTPVAAKRRPEYLNMSGALLNDYAHSNVITRLN